VSPSPVADPAFRILERRVAEQAGIRLRAEKRWLLAARVEARIAARGFGENVLSYAHEVARDDVELGLLVELLRVGETRFFRHPRQLRAIRRIAFPELFARCVAQARGLEVWSAGCASGEEAYTLAMMVELAAPKLTGGSLPYRVRATDLSATAIATAERGIYDAERTRDVPPEARRHLEEVEGGFRVSDALRAKVELKQHNLLSPVYPEGQDLVLCRNVLIYFDDAHRHQVLERLFDAVRPGGYVALGYADSALEVDGCEAVRTDDGILYKRVGTPTVPPPPPRIPTPPRPLERPVTPPPPKEVLALAGTLTGTHGRRVAKRVLAQLLRRGERVLDLRALELADEPVARELKRVAELLASEGRTLELLASGAGTRRFLRRHGVVPPAILGRAP